MLAAGLTFGDLAEGGGVTCVGGGAGSLPMALLQAFPELAVDVVEIDPVVAQAAATFLGLRARGGGPPEEAFLLGLRPRPNNSASAHDPPAAACRLWLRDAAAHLARAPPGSQAAVFVDAFDRDNEVPPQLAAPAFFADCLTALRPGGPLVWNTQFDFEAAPSLAEHCARELALAAVPAGSVGEVSSSPPKQGGDRQRASLRLVERCWRCWSAMPPKTTHAEQARRGLGNEAAAWPRSSSLTHANLPPQVLAVPAGAGEAEPWANVVFVVRKAGGAPMAADALAARCDGLQRALGGDRLGIDVAHELGFDLARERCGVHRINERAWAGAA